MRRWTGSLKLAGALVACLAIGGAGSAGAATLSYTGTLTLAIPAPAPTSATASGGGVYVGPLHISTIAFDAGQFGPLTTSVPVTSSQTIQSVRFSSMGNLTGTFTALSAAPGGGLMGLSGMAKVCLVFAPCWSAVVPVPLSPVGGAGVGVGGTQFVPGGVPLTMQHAPWTVGQPVMTIHTPGSSTTTPALPGGYASPPSATAVNSGVLQLVTATKVFTSLTAAFPELPLFSILNLHFFGRPTPTPSPTPTPHGIPTPSPHGTPTATPGPHGTPTATPGPHGTPMATPDVHGTPASTPSPHGSPAPTPEPHGIPAPSPHGTPTPSPTPTPVGGVTVEWVTVGDPGNACDPQPQGCFGAVDYAYRIGKYEVTNAQYAEFLNAVAATDTYGLYNTSMASGFGGISRSGIPGSYAYSAIVGRENMPVNYVSWYDSLRFANWLHNGQPTGAQDGATTEDGAYTFSGATSVGSRNARATIFLANDDEWYKAAYYDPVSRSYFDLPTGTDVQSTCAAPGPMANTANCFNSVGDLTDVGSYTGSPSPYGTFDQGGNALERNENVLGPSCSGRGGGFNLEPYILNAKYRLELVAINEGSNRGFRVASW